MAREKHGRRRKSRVWMWWTRKGIDFAETLETNGFLMSLCTYASSIRPVLLSFSLSLSHSAISEMMHRCVEAESRELRKTNSYLSPRHTTTTRTYIHTPLSGFFLLPLSNESIQTINSLFNHITRTPPQPLPIPSIPITLLLLRDTRPSRDEEVGTRA